MNKILPYSILIIFFLFIAYSKTIRENDLKKLDKKGKATIAEIVHCDNNGIIGSSPFLTLEFYIDGKRFKKKRHNLGLKNYCKYLGKKIKVIYLPSNPNICKFDLENLK